MNDSDFIISQIRSNLKDTINELNEKLITGNVSDIEDYKYKLGARVSLVKTEEYIDNLMRLK
jgi:hypothetical protein